jgi:hypothetical protein
METDTVTLPVVDLDFLRYWGRRGEKRGRAPSSVEEVLHEAIVYYLTPPEPLRARNWHAPGR